MAYDPELAVRLRAALTAVPHVAERKMFGGLAFLLRGHMTVVASSRGGVMLRADPSTTDELIKTTTARLAEMRGRSMSGWLYLDAVDIASDRQVTQWVDLAVQYTSTLPRKREG